MNDRSVQSKKNSRIARLIEEPHRHQHWIIVQRFVATLAHQTDHLYSFIFGNFGKISVTSVTSVLRLSQKPKCLPLLTVIYD